MNRPSPAMRALLAMAALGAMLPGQNAELGPPVPEPRPPPRHFSSYPRQPSPPVPREPTLAELRAIEKRKRKAARRAAEKARRAR